MVRIDDTPNLSPQPHKSNTSSSFESSWCNEAFELDPEEDYKRAPLRSQYLHQKEESNHKRALYRQQDDSMRD